jgi:8-oxo-dGTP pyrophosphatase MutT (NUDIX family)
MELNTDVLTGLVQAAATVVMLRDGPDGLEVFLIRRHGQSEVLGGAHVFPGGKLDADDSHDSLLACLDMAPAALHEALCEPGLDAKAAAALYVAALREVFEETGVLFAHGVDSTHAAQAAAMLREGMPFGAMAQALSLRLCATSLLPWSRWITPQVASVTRRRFDTRFFVAAAPPAQVATHDNHEATESLWLGPREALGRYWDGAIELAPPQIMSLAHLARHATVAEVLAQARSRRPPVIQPEPFDEDGTRVMCYPGDERHPVRERALPGPTRLHFRNRRFEPADGLAGLTG